MQLPISRIPRYAAMGALIGCSVLLLLLGIAAWKSVRVGAGEGGEWFMTMVYLFGAPFSLLLTLISNATMNRLPFIPIFILLISIPSNGAVIGSVCATVVEVVSRFSRGEE